MEKQNQCFLNRIICHFYGFLMFLVNLFWFKQKKIFVMNAKNLIEILKFNFILHSLNSWKHTNFIFVCFHEFIFGCWIKKSINPAFSFGIDFIDGCCEELYHTDLWIVDVYKFKRIPLKSKYIWQGNANPEQNNSVALQYEYLILVIIISWCNKLLNVFIYIPI